MYSLSLSELCLYVQLLGACPWGTVEIGGFPLLADTPDFSSYIFLTANAVKCIGGSKGAYSAVCFQTEIILKNEVYQI